MKKLLIFLAVFAFSLEINFSSGVLMRSDLKDRFVSYWADRANRDFKDAYKYEMPYLKYIHSLEWYEDFFITAPRIKKIKVKRIDCKDNICYVSMLLKIGKNYIFYRDKWVKVDKIWYHRFRDNALPQ